MHRLGADLSGLREAIEPIRAVLTRARAWGCRIVHTREGYAADLSDLQPGNLAVRRAMPLPSATRGRAAGRSSVASRDSTLFRNLPRHRASPSSTSRATAPSRRPRSKTI